jgi:phosphoserine phosphatase RsbU/P
MWTFEDREMTIDREEMTQPNYKENRSSATTNGDREAGPPRELRHDLRNRVGQIIGYSEMLIEERADAGDAALVRDLEKIREAGRDALLLLEQYAQVTDTILENPSALIPDTPTVEFPDSIPPLKHLEAEPGRLLIVDDSEENRDLLLRRLRRQGHYCVAVETGEEALKQLQEEEFDVVLLDLVLPGMSGLEVLERLKDFPEYQNTCVIMISAVDEMDSVIRCIEMGATDYLTKPFNQILLRARVGACLRDKRHRDREARLFAELEENYRHERHIADIMQRPILREIPEDAFPELAVATLYRAAHSEARVGGDLFDAFAMPGGNIGLVVADASGKGLEAAARTVQVKYALRAYALEKDGGASEIIAHLNRFLCDSRLFDDQGSVSFVTVCLVIVNPATGAMSVINGGGEPPLIVRANGETDSIGTGGPPLGINPEAEYPSATEILHPGDTLLICTDGLTEARRGKEFLEYEGMVRLALDSCALPTLKEMGQSIIDEATRFAEGTLRDDVCLLLARRRVA